MRTSALVLYLGISCLMMAPGALAQSVTVERELGTGDSPPIGANHEDPFQEMPVVSVAAQGALRGDGSASDALDVLGAAPAREEEGSARQSIFKGLPPEAERAAAVAGAGAGLALLLGLLAHALGVPLFSRIQSNKLLDNEVRQRVHDMVVANPGITIKEITGVCAIGWGTAVYHLKRLETERLIVSERNRQFRRYFKNGGGIVNESKAAFGELKNPVTERLAQTIVRSPGSCQKDLCERVGISAPLAHKFLSRLAEAGLISTQREWKKVKYFSTPKLEDLLLLARPMATLEATVAPSPLAAAVALSPVAVAA